MKVYELSSEHHNKDIKKGKTIVKYVLLEHINKVNKEEKKEVLDEIEY